LPVYPELSNHASARKEWADTSPDSDKDAQRQEFGKKRPTGVAFIGKNPCLVFSDRRPHDVTAQRA